MIVLIFRWCSRVNHWTMEAPTFANSLLAS
jgi:hypothetical protein